jgi:hypothetical protein
MLTELLAQYLPGKAAASSPGAIGWANIRPRQSSTPDHVFGDRRLGDLESELQQFTMDTRGTHNGFSQSASWR